jgi:hypothetical protein
MENTYLVIVAIQVAFHDKYELSMWLYKNENITIDKCNSYFFEYCVHHRIVPDHITNWTIVEDTRVTP